MLKTYLEIYREGGEDGVGSNVVVDSDPVGSASLCRIRFESASRSLGPADPEPDPYLVILN